MNYANPELRDRLAAEYALGTLRGAARRRFERLMSGDPSLRDLVREWDQRVNLLAESAPAVEPPAHVWDELAGRLWPEPASKRSEWFAWVWGSIEFWRGASLIAATAAVALVYVALQQPPSVGREQVTALDQRLARIEGMVQPLASPEGLGALNERLAEIETRVAATVPTVSHVAVLIDRTSRPMMTADLDLGEGRLALNLHITPPRDFTGRTLEVWSAPPDGEPRSLGLLPSEKGGTSMVLVLARDVAASLAQSALMVSLEPAGGSTAARPSGPVLFSGPLIPVDL